MSEVHVVPLNDHIDHEDDDCACGPDIEHVTSPNGDGWVVTHHSLDGREQRES